ncbi:MAG: DUF3842 family protein [Ruminococcaceae bacterium]|nr:DUF3842 family protein [Oscillospiraceae bacterium]
MKILVIDGQGGNLGRQLCKMLLERMKDITVRAVGTNSLATESMLKTGVQEAATGENAVIVGAKWADIIIGPIGIVIADALLGEVTAKMAAAVGSAEAKRVLIPMNKCDTIIAGIDNIPTSTLIESAVQKIISYT